MARAIAARCGRSRYDCRIRMRRAAALGRPALQLLRETVMDDISARSLLADPAIRRALQLDSLSAILPMERRDRLAELLTDDDVETLKHLAREGIGENSLRALSSD